MTSPAWTETTPGGAPLIDEAGNEWSIDIGHWLRTSGVDQNFSAQLLVCDWPKLYALSGGAWWEYDVVTSAATHLAGDPRPGPSPAPPAPAPSPVPPPPAPSQGTSMDADIAAATSQLDIERIKAQIYRNDFKDLQARREAAFDQQEAHNKLCIEKQDEMRALLQAQFDELPVTTPPTPEQLIRLRLGPAIAAKYFVTNSNTTPAGWASAAEACAGKFSAALDAAVTEELKR